jgi:bacillithiol biosynthesis cysteine-adding enzyme BshC
VSDPRVLTSPLGGSRLSRAVQEGTLTSLMPARPGRPQDWRARVDAVRSAAGRGWLDALRDAFSANGAARARLERAANGGVVVTTGQQPGLFGGPIYTWSKALSALALADAIERETGVPAAPVFWAATDDADYDEASVTQVLVDGRLARLASTQRPVAGTPMAHAPLGDVSAQLALLRAACGSAANHGALAAVQRAYREGTTVGNAYLALLRAQLEPLGVAVLDASHPALRRAGDPVLRAALRRAPEVERALAGRSQALEQMGFTPQVADVAGLSLVFVHEQGLKRRVPVSEAAGLAGNADAERLSPNVLLRPVLERSILPTVAYVAGPGELAYFAQVPAVAEALGLAQPLAVPRWSCTIVEPAVDRAMQRIGVAPDDLRDITALEARLARAAVPDDTARAVAVLRALLEAGMQGLAEHDTERLLPAAAIEGTARTMAWRLDRLERRLVAAAKRRGSDALRDLHHARDALLPERVPQERALNFIPFLVRYGDGLWAAMRRQADAHAAALVAGGASAHP